MSDTARGLRPSTGSTWPWVGSAALLLGAAATATVATYLFWLPCRGEMTRGLFFVPPSGPPISDACLERMDSGTPFPFASARVQQGNVGPLLAAGSMTLTGLALLVVVLGMRWRLRTTAVALLPGLLSLGLGGASFLAVLNSGHAQPVYPAQNWWLLLEATAVAAMIFVRVWQRDLTGRPYWLLVVIFWGGTGFGWVHVVVDYLFMTLVNTWNHDAPPGCGYPTVVAISVAAGACAGQALRRRRARPHGDYELAAAPDPDRSGGVVRSST